MSAATMWFGVLADEPLTEEEHGRNHLPGALARWKRRGSSEVERAATKRPFGVAKVDISASDCDLSVNRCREVFDDEVECPPPEAVLDNLYALEAGIQSGVHGLRSALA